MYRTIINRGCLILKKLGLQSEMSENRDGTDPFVWYKPSVRWKLLNLDRMDQKKRTEAIAKLEAVLRGDKDA